MNICTSFTYKMAAKTSWHRYGTKLSHCHHMYTNTLHTFNDPFSGTTQVSQYQKGKTSLDFSEASDSEWQ